MNREEEKEVNYSELPKTIGYLQRIDLQMDGTMFLKYILCRCCRQKLYMCNLYNDNNKLRRLCPVCVKRLDE